MSLVNGIYTAADVHLDEVNDYDGGVTLDSDPKTCVYTHFNLSTEQLGRTGRYNCWGFTFLPRRYWLGRNDVNNIIRDNCDPVSDGSIQVGDVIRYQDFGGDGNLYTTHTGRVWQTDGAGHATWIRSKWGGWAEYIHTPLDVPDSYGTHLAYFRQRAPLKGNTDEIGKIADLWIKDSPTDDGEQYSGAPWWTSPDILVDTPPYDGIPDLNPVFDHTNHVWALVRNRINQRVENVYIRYYWADPSIGLGPANWNLIPDTPGYPNPAGPIAIDGNSSIEAPYVEWTPTAAPAHQCLLAIAYVNDNPSDSNNPNPIVYPFDIPWDNNIAQRNVHIIELENGSNAKLSINTGAIFQKKSSLNAVLTYSPRLPIIGFSDKVVPLKVTLTFDNKVYSLKALSRYLRSKRAFTPDYRCVGEKPIAGTTFITEKVGRLGVEITAPKNVKSGSIYYVHITQSVSNNIIGGYTIAILIV
jgi:hypothetical protein